MAASGMVGSHALKKREDCAWKAFQHTVSDVVGVDERGGPAREVSAHHGGRREEVGGGRRIGLSYSGNNRESHFKTRAAGVAAREHWIPAVREELVPLAFSMKPAPDVGLTVLVLDVVLAAVRVVAPVAA